MMIRYAIKPNGTGWAVTRTTPGGHALAPNSGPPLTTTESWHKTEAEARREASLKAAWEHVAAADAGSPVPEVTVAD
jgi:hypothetical protein